MNRAQISSQVIALFVFAALTFAGAAAQAEDHPQLTVDGFKGLKLAEGGNNQEKQSKIKGCGWKFPIFLKI